MLEIPKQPIDKKRLYFTNLSLRVREALKLHKHAGLWDRRENKREWGNVTEHCLVEAARTEVFADILRLPDDIRKDLLMAAAVHDFFKKGEKEIVTPKGLTWECFDEAFREAERHMHEAGLPKRVIRFANGVGHDSLLETERLLARDNLSEEDIAYLVLHYIDDYTINDDWALPPTATQDGRHINDFERRMQKNDANPRYARLNEDGRAYFHGETTFEAQRRIGMLIQEKLTQLLNERGGLSLKPEHIPTFIDAEILAKIESKNF